MSDNPVTLRLYASIFEKEWRDFRDGPLNPPTPACIAAAKALRFTADAIEANPSAEKRPSQIDVGKEF